MAFLTLTPTILILSFFTLACALSSTNETLTSEIAALTAVKLTLSDPLASLSGWDPSTPSAPCDWHGVTCSSLPRHVTDVSLPRLGLSGPLSDRISDLRFLRRLSLRFNSFNGTLPLSLSTLSTLQLVFLQSNAFSGSLVSLSNITSLRVINLANNSFAGPIPTSFPRTLRILDLSANSFSGEIPADVLASLPALELINLSYNNLSGTIPATLGVLQGLKYLSLDYNQLSGPIPAAISNCSALVHFSAEGNSLAGVIPAGLPALPELQVISLSRNDLSGTIPSSVFCHVSRVSVSPSLSVVQLGFNGFTEMAPDVMSNCDSVLRVLDLQHNQIKGVFPAWLVNLSSSIVKLDLSGNMFSGPIPRGISNLVNLEELRLRNNSLSGNLPVEIRNCSSLQVLDLGDNQFSGEFPTFLGDMRVLKSLFLGGNLFSGKIPASLGNLTGVQSLDVGDNGLSGLLPVELFALSNLTTLNLSGNHFSGPIPASIGNLKQLIVLNLSGNGFSGVIPESLGNLYMLNTLDLSKQELRGELPLELSGLPNLRVVALQENKLNGDIPQGFSSLLGLTHLNLSSNNFTGTVPPTFGYLKSMVVLSLSNNYISGSIPPEIGNCSSLQVLEFGSNSLAGHIPPDISHLSHLTKLDLSRNNLSGEIPEQLSNCSALDSIFLDGNRLSGVIPLSLSNLVNLTTLDLSQNNLIGEIPQNLTAIPSLSHFNVSGNNLQGEIPRALGLRFGDQSDFANNQNLCGKPLDMKCGSLKKDGKTRLVWLLVVSIAGTFLLVLFCCFYIFSVLRWRKKLKEGATKDKKRSPARASSGARSASHRGSSDSSTAGPKLVMFNNKITLSETIEATRNFDEENVLSRTKYGLVFKASYNDGMVLAIRKLSSASLSENTFKKEAENLGKVKHRNLTVLRGYYAGPPDLRLVVHDYMPNGNLATLLQEASHQDGHVLNWPMRHLIALGVARGLAFLHTSYIVHGDVKPQNVLFDADFEAHLSDFGLEKLIVVNSSEPSTSTHSVGYLAPEGGIMTKESDVYSFGIILLELLTGKRAVMFTQDEDIVKWVKRQLQTGQITELLEPRLLELDPESSEWEEFLLGIKVGLLCTAPDPLDRPTMPDVVFMLEGCRVGPDIPSSADPTSQHSPA